LESEGKMRSVNVSATGLQSAKIKLQGTQPSARRMALAGFSASLVGIGLARFAYTPLLPAIIQAGWFVPAQASYLGAANLVGYLLGALAAASFANRLGTTATLRLMMALATLSFLACAWPLSFAWFFAWRLLAGITGGALMVLAAPAILHHVEPRQAGFITGAIFTGIGVGIAISGTLMPLLLGHGLTVTWLGLAAVAFLLTASAWQGWPRDGGGPAAPPAMPSSGPSSLTPSLSRPVLALALQYGFDAVGLVPHMIFLVDFIARALGRGVAVGAGYWILFGMSAMVGPVVAGRAADRFGARRTLRFAYILQSAAVASLLISDKPVVLAVSAVIMGALTPGIVPLTLARLTGLLPDPMARRRAWSVATATFAVGQAGAAYLFTVLLDHWGGYEPIFAVAAAALAAALLVDVIVRSRA
jgi:predicted MFS family arabinose efflux permease